MELPEGLEDDLVRVSSSLSDSMRQSSTETTETTVITLIELPRGGINIGDTIALPEENFGSIGEVANAVALPSCGG